MAPARRPDRHLIRWGWLATFVYIAAVATYAASRSSDVAAMSLHDQADAMAGVFAPLAFLWLVLGFFQQGHELRNSHAALVLQGEELRNSVEQQRALVDVTKEQLTLERETREEAEREADRMARPDLILRYNGGSQSGGDLTMRWVLSNAGARCSHVEVSTDVHGQVDSSPTLGGDPLEFILRYDATTPPQNTLVTVHYRDVRGREGAETFVLKATGDSRGVRLEPSA